MKIFVIASLMLFATTSFGATESADLNQDLESLKMPENTLPMGVEKEKLYSVQSRYSSLALRPEILVGGAYNFTNNSYLNSYQGDAGLRFHISNRFSVGASYSWVANSFSQDAKHLIDDKQVLPDVPYVKNKTELDVAYNVFYGKFRLGMDSVYYFDQYVSLGVGRLDMSTGTETAYIGDVGFAFWLSTWGSLRVGVKDYYYKETSQAGRSAYAHNVHGHIGVGYLF